MTISFSVDGHPEPAGSKRAFVVKGRAVVTDSNRKQKPWQALVSSAAQEAKPDGDLLDGPIWLTLRFRVNRPKGHFTSKGTLSASGQRNPWPVVRPDVLKLARGVEDALTAVIWRDDSQIVVEHLTKVYTTGPEGVDVRIEPAGVTI